MATADTCDAAAQVLAKPGLRPTVVDGIIYFRMSDSIRLDDDSDALDTGI